MEETTLLVVNGLLRAALAAIYTFIGLKLTRRETETGARTALTLFGVWWYGLAVSSTLSATTGLLHASGVLSLPLALALAQANVIAICVALWGLLYYLGYLFTGRRSILAPMTVAYAAFAFLLLYAVAAAGPIDVASRHGTSTLVYERPIGGAWLATLATLLLAPHLIGAVAYASLYFRSETRAQRYRIGMVAGAVFGWFGAAGVASAMRWTLTPWWPPTSLAIAMLASIAILLAYHPPRWAQERWRLVGVDAEPPVGV